MPGLRILQFGRTGQVGIELLVRGLAHGHQVTALGRDKIDLAQPRRIASSISLAGLVDVVINGAAYTQVDKAESEPERATAVNAESVGALAEFCSRRGVPLIQLSTDYVFDGTKATPYREDDPTAPANVYGRSKFLGEEAVRTSHPRHIILRTSWVYSAHGTNFVKTMLKLGAEREELRIVDDQKGTPTSAGDIAEACLFVSERVCRDPGFSAWGTYHFAAKGETTWRRFAEAIFEDASAWAALKARIVPITSNEYPTAAKRPLNSRLDCEKFDHTFGLPRRPWRDALRAVLAEIRADTESPTKHGPRSAE